MKRHLFAAVALAALCAAPGTAETLAIVHAKAWTMTAADPVADATIVIDNGKVASVTAGGGVPQGAQIIDARGNPVTPGLVNSATQIGLIEVSSASATNDLSSASRGIGAGFDPSPALNPNSVLVALARADGVTGALVYPGKSPDAPFSGRAALLKLRSDGGILDHATAGVVAVIGGGEWKDAGSRAAQWQLLRRALAKGHGGGPGGGGGGKGRGGPAGPDGTQGGPPPGSDEQAIAAVMARDVPLILFSNRESDMREAARLAGEFNIRIIIVGGGEAWRAADVLAAAHIPVVLDPQANMPGSFDALGNRLDASAILNRAGVTIGFGLVGGAIEASYNAGLDLREGAGLAVANGLPYLDALKAMTVNAHQFWGGGKGVIAPGETADLVVWDGDPLEVSSNATHVIIEGREADTDTRQKALARRYLNAGAAR